MCRIKVSKAEKDYETANLKFSSGSATRTDVLDAKETLLKAQASITTAESNIASTKESPVPDAWMEIWRISRNLCITGPAGTDECIGQPRRDIAKAQENNYQLKILARQVNNAMTSTLKEQYQTTLTSGREAVKSNVQSAYQNLKLSEAQYEQAKRSLELEEKTKQTNDRKLAAGLISQNAYRAQPIPMNRHPWQKRRQRCRFSRRSSPTSGRWTAWRPRSRKGVGG